MGHERVGTATELFFDDTKELLDSYVAEGPGQIVAPLPGPPAPGTFAVGGTLEIVLGFRDRELRIPVRCRVLGVHTDGLGHWKVQLEFLAMRDAHHTLAEARVARAEPPWAPHLVRVRTTLPDGRQFDLLARALEAEGLWLDRRLPVESGEIVRLAIRSQGRIWPLRLVAEVRPDGGSGSALGLLFRTPSEELAWKGLLAEVGRAAPPLLLA